MKTEIKTIIKIGAFVGKWPRLLTTKEVKEIESYVSEGRDPCPELLAKAEALMMGLQVGDRKVIELERENAELKQQLTTACDRIRDMLEGDDGQAWKEARTFLRRIGQPESIAEKEGARDERGK